MVASRMSEQKEHVASRNESFPRLLRRLRERNNWSQEKLAERARVAKVTVHRWECGTTSPGPYHRRILCEILGVPSDRLFPETLPVIAPSVLPARRSTSEDAGEAVDGWRILGSVLPKVTAELFNEAPVRETSLAAERLQLERLEIQRKSLDAALSIVNSLITTRYPELEGAKRGPLASRLLIDLLELPEGDLIRAFLLRPDQL